MDCDAKTAELMKLVQSYHAIANNPVSTIAEIVAAKQRTQLAIYTALQAAYNKGADDKHI